MDKGPTAKKHFKRIHSALGYIQSKGLVEPKTEAIETGIILLIMNITNDSDLFFQRPIKYLKDWRIQLKIFKLRDHKTKFSPFLEL